MWNVHVNGVKCMGLTMLTKISVAAEGEKKRFKKKKKEEETSSKPQILPDSSVAVTGAPPDHQDNARSQSVQ